MTDGIAIATRGRDPVRTSGFLKRDRSVADVVLNWILIGAVGGFMLNTILRIADRDFVGIVQGYVALAVVELIWIVGKAVIVMRSKA